MQDNKRTTKQVIAEQQAINRKLWAKENGRLHHVDANKLIAEFMGVPQGEHTHFMVEPFALESYANVDDLKYDISWDWLMPVVQKCFDTQQPQEGQHYFINESLLTMDIEVVYDRVVEFINQYNKTK